MLSDMYSAFYIIVFSFFCGFLSVTYADDFTNSSNTEMKKKAQIISFSKEEQELMVQNSFGAALQLRQLAITYYEKGKYIQALPLFQYILTFLEKRVGTEHLVISTSLNDLAKTYYVIGMYQKAKPLYQHALAIREKELGIEHLDTAIILNNLAILYRAMGIYKKAESLYQRALIIQKKQLDLEHPDISNRSDPASLSHQI